MKDSLNAHSMLILPWYHERISLARIHMNRVVHFEIHAADQDGIQKFYQELFGWEFQDMGSDMGNYRVITTGPGPEEMAKGVGMENLGINGGLTRRSGNIPQVGASPNAFVSVIGVGDTDAIVAKALELGGKIALEAMDVPGVGRLAYVLDPENNIFGVLTPDMSMMHPEGSQ
jgi:predicted enzyme related to lactoylglutathione lyase